MECVVNSITVKHIGGDLYVVSRHSGMRPFGVHILCSSTMRHEDCFVVDASPMIHTLYSNIRFQFYVFKYSCITLAS